MINKIITVISVTYLLMMSLLLSANAAINVPVNINSTHAQEQKETYMMSCGIKGKVSEQHKGSLTCFIKIKIEEPYEDKIIAKFSSNKITMNENENDVEISYRDLLMDGYSHIKQIIEDGKFEFLVAMQGGRLGFTTDYDRWIAVSANPSNPDEPVKLFKNLSGSGIFTDVVK